MYKAGKVVIVIKISFAYQQTFHNWRKNCWPVENVLSEALRQIIEVEKIKKIDMAWEKCIKGRLGKKG